MFVLKSIGGRFYTSGTSFDVLGDDTAKYDTIEQAVERGAQLVERHGIYAYPVKFTKTMLPRKPRAPKAEPFAALKARARKLMSDDTIRKYGKLNCRATFEKALAEYVPTTAPQRRSSTTYKAMCPSIPDYSRIAHYAGHVRNLEFIAA